MKSIAHMYGRSPRSYAADYDVAWIDPKQLIGIEIEAERFQGQVTLPDADEISLLWASDGDGSLRDGVEYRLSQPLSGSSLSRAISEFFAKVSPRRAVTSGTHIHVDMMEETTSVGSLQALYLLMFVLEPAVFSIVDKGRQWCGYTNSLDSAPPELHAVMLKDGLENHEDALRSVTQLGRKYKYYGLNFMPLNRFGSVEFRYFPTCSSKEELTNWVQLCMSFKAAAVAAGSKEAVAAMVQDDSAYHAFVNNHFAQWAQKILEEIPHITARRRACLAMLKHTSGDIKKSSFNQAVVELPRFKKFFGKASKRMAERRANVSTGYFAQSRFFYEGSSAAGTLGVVTGHLNQSGLHIEDYVRDGDFLVGTDALYMYVGNWISFNDLLRNSWDDMHSRRRTNRVFLNFFVEYPRIISHIMALMNGNMTSSIRHQINTWASRIDELSTRAQLRLAELDDMPAAPEVHVPARPDINLGTTY